MKKKVNNKKGFTLAELLVVLAILAVLVAVAIPLFTGAISQAQETTKNANSRAIRAAAVTEILTNDSVKKTGPWVAQAKISPTGEMTELKVWQVGESGAPAAPADDAAGQPTDVDGTYTVSVKEAKS